MVVNNSRQTHHNWTTMLWIHVLSELQQMSKEYRFCHPSMSTFCIMPCDLVAPKVGNITTHETKAHNLHMNLHPSPKVLRYSNTMHWIVANPVYAVSGCWHSRTKTPKFMLRLMQNNCQGCVPPCCQVGMSYRHDECRRVKDWYPADMSQVGTLGRSDVESSVKFWGHEPWHIDWPGGFWV